MIPCLSSIYIGTVLGIKEESRLGVVQTLWNYIKVQGLQDKVDRRLIRADDKLRPVRSLSCIQHVTFLWELFQIFGVEPVIFQKLPEIVNRYLADRGIDASRVQIVSYGEEKPACTTSRDDECRAKNRRDEFVILSGL